MTTALNETHDASLTSWVAEANAEDAEFPVQNLPFGVFQRGAGKEAPRVGVAIGDRVLDVSACGAAGLLPDATEAAAACTSSSLNRLMALGPSHWSRLRIALSRLLRSGSELQSRTPTAALLRAAECEMRVPAEIGDYSDFFASIHHATNVGRMFRPGSPLLANYKYLPIAYHGRASSIVISETPLQRPIGQTQSASAEAPVVGPSRRLDYELELGVFLGTGNALGHSIALENAERHVFGLCLVNDWSARDIQTWEYQPLGPFLGKSFGTTVSPWIVTVEALAPFRIPRSVRAPGDPRPLPYLSSEGDARRGGIDIGFEIELTTAKMRSEGHPPHTLARTSSRHLYWTIFQMIAHHTINGCNLRPGDLIASGTLSGPEPDAYGSLLEATLNGTKPFALPGGESRTFLEDGDEVTFRGRCSREGYRSIGFGTCRGVIAPARDQA